MKSRARALCAFSCVMVTLSLLAPAFSEEPARKDIDWNRARELYERDKKGETLSADEQAYLDRAKQQRQKGGGRVPDRGNAPSSAPRDSTGLKPLTDMGADDKYKGESGGLYGGWLNVPPEAHDRAALKEVARIEPLDAEGRPAPNGAIVLVSIGMSNTTQEFSRFKAMADRDKEKSPTMLIVDGAQGGRDVIDWIDLAGGKADPVWAEMDKRLKAAGATPGQVQAAWIKQAIKGPGRLGEFPAPADQLKADLMALVILAKTHFPNLRLAFLSSRIYAGYATTPLNPEPHAYESAFAVRWAIEEQISGNRTLNWDPVRGAIKAPVLLWGPYLWADGIAPRQSDGLVWKKEDLAGDGTHPSDGSGRDKVAELLLRFFKTDPHTKPWFFAQAP